MPRQLKTVRQAMELTIQHHLPAGGDLADKPTSSQVPRWPEPEGVTLKSTQKDG